jgi:hypothetical protein
MTAKYWINIRISETGNDDHAFTISTGTNNEALLKEMKMKANEWFDKTVME